MADIDIERKGAAIWPWIIGAIVLALLIWALAEMLGDDDDVDAPVATVVEPAGVTPAPVTDAGPAAVPAPVQQYLTTCAPREPAAMGLDHQYTSNCIQQLVAAVDAMLQEPNLAGVDVQAQMQTARENAQRLTASANESTQHAAQTREALVSIGTVLSGVQDARFPNLDAQATQVEETARSVQGSGNLLDQREPVQRFFQQAGDLLSGMAMAPGAG